MSRGAQLLQKHKALIGAVAALALYITLAYCFHLPCPIRWFTGISCPGCGMTRAVAALCVGDVVGAWQYHPLVFYLATVAPLWAVVYARRMRRAHRVLLAVTVALFLGVYLWRLWMMPSAVMVFLPWDGAWMTPVRWIASLFG